MKMAELKLIYVEWEDASGVAHWQTQDELEDWIENGSPIIRQVGWVYKETSEALVLVCRRGVHIYDGDTVYMESYGLVQRIPKTWIRARHVLHLPDPVRRKAGDKVK